MKRLWDALFDPYMGIVLPMIFINLGAQIVDLFTDFTFNYFFLSLLLTVAYIGGVLMSLVLGRTGE
jgi:hypothetical protein